MRRIVAISLALMTAVVACIPYPGRVDPARERLSIGAPDSFLVQFETTKGSFDVMARSNWAPVGVDRFYELMRQHYYDDVAFFRVVGNFVAQFGITDDPAINAAWRVRRIADDSVRHGNTRGSVSFARGGPGSRTVQLYINLVNNPQLDTSGRIGFPAIAEVVSGMNVVESLYSGYSRPRVQPPSTRPDSTPSQDSISRQGNAFLKRRYPQLDYIKTARVTREWRSPRPTRP